jgi:hypothetical protein
MYNRDIVGAARVRMGVVLRDTAMRSPPGMADANKPFHPCKVKAAVHLAYLANPFSYGNLIS